MNDNNFYRKKSTKSTKRFENGSHTKREFSTEDKKEDNMQQETMEKIKSTKIIKNLEKDIFNTRDIHYIYIMYYNQKNIKRLNKIKPNEFYYEPNQERYSKNIQRYFMDNFCWGFLVGKDKEFRSDRLTKEENEKLLSDMLNFIPTLNNITKQLQKGEIITNDLSNVFKTKFLENMNDENFRIGFSYFLKEKKNIQQVDFVQNYKVIKKDRKNQIKDFVEDNINKKQQKQNCENTFKRQA